MALWLKQSTTVNVKVGPYLDDTDGKTAEIGLTVAVELSKNGGAFAARNSATATAHDAEGYYTVELNTTDTNTLGRLQLKSLETGALPVWHEFLVVPAMVYDSLVAGTDTLHADAQQWLGTAIASPDTAGYPKVTVKDGTGAGEIALTSGAVDTVTSVTNTVNANVTQLSGDSTAADNAESFFDGTGYAGTNNVIPTVTTLTNKTGFSLAATGLDAIAQSATGVVEIAKAVWDRVISGANHNVASSAARFLRQASEAVALHQGTAQAGGATTITLDTGASSVDDLYNDERVSIIEGTGAGQSRIITDYVGSTRVATVDHAWVTNPDSTSLFVITGAEVVLSQQTHTGATVPTVTSVTNGVTLANGAVTAAAIATDAIDSDALAASAVSELQSGLATSAALTSLDGKVDTIDTNVDAILDDTGSSGVVVAAGSKSGYSLSSAGVQAIWDALTSALTTASSIGKLLVDNINATISSRLASASYTAPPSAATIADTVWDEAIADHQSAGSAGEALDNAGSAGDPWSTALPGAYGSGTAGNIVGNRLDAAVSTRLPTSSYTSPPSAATIADTVWDEATADHSTAGSTGKALSDVLDDTGTSGVVVASGSKTGYALTSSERDSIAAALLDLANGVETGYTVRQTLRIMAAALAGELSGAATTTITIRNLADSKARITATVDADGNRTALTLDGD